jgi:Fe-Mn family superoxide dismutase
MIKSLIVFLLISLVCCVLANLDTEDVKLPSLPYDYPDLEPIIDRETMKLHHTGHHQKYTDNVNAALKQLRTVHGGLLKKCKNVDDLLHFHMEITPYKLQKFVINNGGGYVNHALFWKTMISPSQYQPPSERFVKAISSIFGSFDQFVEEFSYMATESKTFGSGWVWLVSRGPFMVIKSYKFQNPPVMYGEYPILGLDVWEHAYYLQYKNKRDTYIRNWWKVVNWKFVEERFFSVYKEGTTDRLN